ncbi:hypothetical protein [Streptomyces sp. NPDC058694]|uniref:hypothetical protein n=1 Tax=Streptomyces sp. NPDC058694 TaxID=3346603 RepID=UPI00365E87E5
MATYSRRTITTVREEFTVPAAPPYGAAGAEVGKAWALADREYREFHGVPEGEALPDNAISFHPGDDEIVISYEKRVP